MSEIAQLQEERDFMDWYQSISQAYGLDPDPSNPLHFYDWKGAFRAGVVPDELGHWPSRFKLLGHPNLIVDGIDTRTGKRAAGDLVHINSYQNYRIKEMLSGQRERYGFTHMEGVR